MRCCAVLPGAAEATGVIRKRGDRGEMTFET